jgi:AhpD family alkylhydroperoxidase
MRRTAFLTLLILAALSLVRTGADAELTIDGLRALATERLRATARVPLSEGADTPSYLRALSDVPHMVAPIRNVVETFLTGGTLPPDVKAAMGLRIAQVTRSPYIAAHMIGHLRSAARGQTLLTALSKGSLDGVSPSDRVAIEYADMLTRDVNGVLDNQFAEVRGQYNDSELVELTMTVAFFNYMTRYTEALRLPVERWALEPRATAPAAAGKRARARIALISDAEIAATSAAVAAARIPDAQRQGLGLGMANSQRAMLRVPDLAAAWRAVGAAARDRETVGRDIKLQVSFAVSMANGCRYCTLHQVLGLRRLGVDPEKLVAMRKDDATLTPRELVAVQFARKLTEMPSALTDADFSALEAEFGRTGAMEVLLQTCNFAFMNRFTDGLRLPSEDEAIRVYQETYGTATFEGVKQR